MNITSSSTIILAVLVVVAAVAAIAGVVAYRRRQSLRLRKRFGAEYRRAVEHHGGQAQAEADLRKREARVAKLNIRPLAKEEAMRFSSEWVRLQGRFVDNPKGAVAEADKLVRELMSARGYPMGDFERRASDISVDHPGVVDSYRAAQVIAVKDARGEADTEDRRKAIVHYRALFSDLLEVNEVPAAAHTHPGVAVQS